jgi:hypothetical protein
MSAVSPWKRQERLDSAARLRRRFERVPRRRQPSRWLRHLSLLLFKVVAIIGVGGAVMYVAPDRTGTSSGITTEHNVGYRNCAAVRAAGKAPLMRGQPGYARHLDRDDDGIACELWRGRR